MTAGAGDWIDTTNIKDQIAGFLFDRKDLLRNLTPEGLKFIKFDKR
ncbi:MAG: hypothetical protein AB7G48_10655 [Nitrospiraceae bacterium]